MQNTPHIYLAHAYWKEHLLPGDCVIDATCGNGWDTLVLAELPLSLIISLDIQQIALDSTREKLKKSFTHIRLVQLCHSKLDTLTLSPPPRLIIYNLGYLPGGNKSITTQTDTTLQSLNISSNLLPVGGALSITCYPGHPEGKREETAILEWAEQLPSAQWQVCHHRFVNRSSAPSLFWIRKLSI